MQELLANYLFQYKTCPLPGIGSLYIKEKSASFVLGEKLLYPPSPVVSYSTAERSPEELITYISVIAGISKQQAASDLEGFCNQLKGLEAYGEIEIPVAGKFSVDVEGTLMFSQNEYPETFLPPVYAERVIHPESTHKIIVGDKESDSALMTEYYSELKPHRKPSWWIAALVMLLFAVTAIIIYFANDGNSTFGNAQKIEVKEAGKTYNN